MTATIHDTKIKRKQLIEQILAALAEKVDSDSLTIIQNYVRQFLILLSYDDLREYTIMDMAGMLLSFWQFIQPRQAGQTRVRVFNPTFEEHGWQSPHTIIEIIQDDMPFLVDSARMEINRHKLSIHSIIHAGGIQVERDQQHNISEVLPWGGQTQNSLKEAPIHIEVDRNTDLTFLQQLQHDLEKVLTDVQYAVSDWHAMCGKIEDSIDNLSENPPSMAADELEESIDLLRWLVNDNFTFLGCRDYELVGEGDEKALKMLPESGLGVLRDTSKTAKFRHLSDMTIEALELMLSPQALIIAKTNTLSTVHRPVYTDYIGVKRFDKKGNLIGERRFIGLFTSSAYNSSPEQIPFLRLKIAKILDSSGMLERSHSRKALMNILETFPRNDLFQASTEELSEIVFGIFSIQERCQVRLFMRKDVYGRYVSCLVYIPKHQFNNDLRQTIQEILEWNLSGKTAEYYTFFGDSVLARIHFIIRIDPNDNIDCVHDDIEKQLINAVNSWRDQLQELLLEYYGEEDGLQLYQKYQRAFPAGYREWNTALVGVSDIKHIQKLSAQHKMIFNLYRPIDAEVRQFNFKIYQADSLAPLSDVMPILENMGMRVIGEHPYEITLSEQKTVWINDFQMEFGVDVPVNLNNIKENFETAFAKIWRAEVENDKFNKLIILSQLNWHQVTLLRAIAKYIRQMGVTYGQTYIEQTLITYPKIAKMLVEFFNLRFNPNQSDDQPLQLTSIESKLSKALENVISLDDDRILRLYSTLIKALLRTNYYQVEQGHPKAYLAFKFAPKEIPQLPKPRPEFEIFIYSASFEGVHLRCGKVARGGLRWSDRREDFRTEVLGLMKAQQVKNSLIVPTGAKGGFFVKAIRPDMSREQQLKIGVACYQDFIRGLLDITDNIIAGEIQPPKKVVCYDEVDPYLVVAADKGTATFSDIANDISEEYHFWLKDAFASGGKTGYDHKKMGITAKGAWVSVARHFKNLALDVQTQAFTVAGIGDMSGDVFGNGMLLSNYIRLQADFDHRHIFIDPEPNAAKSYKERQRLFALPRSSWDDYNRKLISKGGGIFSRREKSIALSKEIQQLLDIDKDYIVPNDLIKAILRMKVDLLWNGGIGTYVKATSESHNDVGDRGNNGVRVNADELNCRVIGEGGNLGLTQLARIEFSLNGGEVYTDFIDNSAGVDCSDKEVNLKILLNKLVDEKKLSLGQRNRMLKEMTDEISELVLSDNRKQTRAIELARAQAVKQVDLYDRFANLLEEKKILDKSLEALPNAETLEARKANGQGFTAPEISVLVSYSKILLQTRLLESDVPEDPWLIRILFTVFPKQVVKRFSTELMQHSLRREIITTQLSNELVNEGGAVFIYRMYHETGAAYNDIVRAYVISRDIFNLPELWDQIKTLDFKVSANTQVDMMLLVSKLVRRASRWMLRKYREDLNIQALTECYKPKLQKLSRMLEGALVGERKQHFEEHLEKYRERKVPDELAIQLALYDGMFCSLDIIDAALSFDLSLDDVLKCYFLIGQQLNLSWLRYQIRQQKNETHWEGLALAGIFDDIDHIQKLLAVSVLTSTPRTYSIDNKVKIWMKNNQRLTNRWLRMIANMRSSNTISPVMLFVGLRELGDLAQGSKVVTDPKV